MSVYTIRNRHMQVSVSEHGAELQSITGADGTEYLWQGDSRYWSDRAPNLFPYIARLTDGQYYLDGKLYSMDIHGFALYSDFTVIRQSSGSVTLELRDDESIYARYPRHCAFRITYTLNGNTLKVGYEVENLDSRTMYFAVGGHPGFNVPLDRAKSFEDYRVRFPEASSPVRIGFTKQCFLSGEDSPFPLDAGGCLALHHNLFDDDAIVLTGTGHSVVLESDSGHSLRVDFPEMDFLGIWHQPKTDAPYVCLEPWLALPSTQGQIAVLEEQRHLVHLPAGEKYSNEWRICIDAH